MEFVALNIFGTQFCVRYYQTLCEKLGIGGVPRNTCAISYIKNSKNFYRAAFNSGRACCQARRSTAGDFVSSGISR